MQRLPSKHGTIPSMHSIVTSFRGADVSTIVDKSFPSMFSTIGFVAAVVSGRVVVGNGVVAFVGKGLAGVAAWVNVLEHKSKTIKVFRINYYRNL